MLIQWVLIRYIMAIDTPDMHSSELDDDFRIYIAGIFGETFEKEALGMRRVQIRQEPNNVEVVDSGSRCVVELGAAQVIALTETST